MAAIERFRGAALITARNSAFLVAALSLASACSAESAARRPVASPAQAEVPRAQLESPRAETTTDERIRAAVDRRLVNVDGVSAQSLRVDVENGIVTLRGKVNRGDQRAHAAELAVRTPGVRAVVNRLVIGGAAEPAMPLRVASGIARTDQEIAEAVARSLHSDEYLGARPLKFLVEHGRVHLSGQVQTVFEKHWARSRARVPGVIAVEDEDVRVLSNPEPPQVYSATSPSDLETASSIRDAFRADPRVPGATVGLDVEYGVVTLTGAVSTLEQKLAAGEDAQNAPGTSAVVNRLEVRAGAAATAQDLEAQVLARLRSHPSVSADRIRVTTRGQAVMLEGEVGSPFERTVAERAAASVPGVLVVDNQLAIGAIPRNFRDDQQIKAEVERELAIDPTVDGAHIRVSVEHGIVTIRGKVANAQVYDAVLTKAFEASPRGVVNELWRAEPEHFVYSD
jgi:osmotically-inducible protein OsmY